MRFTRSGFNILDILLESPAWQTLSGLDSCGFLVFCGLLAGLVMADGWAAGSWAADGWAAGGWATDGWTTAGWAADGWAVDGWAADGWWLGLLADGCRLVAGLLIGLAC